MPNNNIKTKDWKPKKKKARNGPPSKGSGGPEPQVNLCHSHRLLHRILPRDPPPPHPIETSNRVYPRPPYPLFQSTALGGRRRVEGLPRFPAPSKSLGSHQYMKPVEPPPIIPAPPVGMAQGQGQATGIAQPYPAEARDPPKSPPPPEPPSPSYAGKEGTQTIIRHSMGPDLLQAGRSTSLAVHKGANARPRAQGWAYEKDAFALRYVGLGFGAC